MTKSNIEHFYNSLSDDVGLKIDSVVLFNKEVVLEYITSHQELFQEIALQKPMKESTFYGYNQFGYPFKIGYNEFKIKSIVMLKQIFLPKRVKMIIAYDGTFLSGFQIQKNARSVLGEFTKVISEINDCETKISGASRTDAGVHAMNQVIHFDTSRNFTKEKWQYIVNKRLPKDIHIINTEFVHPLFHSRYDVLKKEYRYILSKKEYNPLRRNFEWCVDGIDFVILKNNLEDLIGTHDFASFCTGEKDSKVRTIYEAYFIDSKDQIELVFVGNGFLHHMIRLIVFQLVKLAKKESDFSIKFLLAQKSRQHTTKLAFAGGLYLSNIIY